MINTDTVISDVTFSDVIDNVTLIQKWQNNILNVQINSMSLINFRKFIIGDKKWVLYDNLKRRKSWIDQPSDWSTIDIDHESYARKKSFDVQR